MIQNFEVKGNVEERDAWLADPYARYAVGKAREEVAVRIAKLVAVCQESSDPNVLRALGKYEQVAAVAAFLSQKRQADEDE